MYCMVYVEHVCECVSMCARVYSCVASFVVGQWEEWVGKINSCIVCDFTQGNVTEADNHDVLG